MADVKFSQFVNGGAIQSGDKAVGLRSGVNTQFNLASTTNQLPQGSLNWYVTNDGGTTDNLVTLPTIEDLQDQIDTKMDDVPLTKGQLILGTDTVKVAGDIISSDSSVGINTDTNGQIDLSVESANLPVLDQGQLIMGVHLEEPVAGDLTSSDGSLIIDTGTNGVIDFRASSSILEGLQDAYNIGNTIELQEGRTVEIGRGTYQEPIEGITSLNTVTTTAVTAYKNWGWTFIPTEQIVVTAFQYPATYFGSVGTRPLGLWIKSSNHILLTNDVVSATDPLSGGYRTKILDIPVVLQVGVEYIINAIVPANDTLGNPVPADATFPVEIDNTGFCSGASGTSPIPISYPTSFSATTGFVPSGFFQFSHYGADVKFSVNGDTDASYVVKIEGTTKGSIIEPVMGSTDFNVIPSKDVGLSAFSSDSLHPLRWTGSDVETVAYISDIPIDPILTQGQLIMGVTGDPPVAGDITSSDGSVVVDVSVDGVIDLTVSDAVLPSLEQGELIIGVTGDDPVAGKLISSDNSIQIDVSEDGLINIGISPGSPGSLQEAYALGNAIQMVDERPVQIYSVGTVSDTTEAITTPSSGSSSTINYAIQGWVFTASVSIWVTSLQYLDANFPSGTRDVGIYLKSNSEQIISAKVLKTGPLVGFYRTTELPDPVFLQQGIQYVIASVVYPSENYNLNNDAVPSAEISPIQRATGAVSTNPIPLTCPTTYINAPNVTPTGYFQYEIITPSASASFIPGADGDAAFFKVESSNLGTVPVPVMTEFQINGIDSPYEGVQAWNSDLHQPEAYNGSQWKYGSYLGRSFPTGAVNPMTVDNEYYTQSSSLVTLQMPTTGAYVGSKIKIIAPGAGGFKVQLNPGQMIKITISGNQGSTSSGGYMSNVFPPLLPVTGVQIGAVAELTCTTANTVWTVSESMGSLLFQ